jgi:phosphohistidine phosphatase
VTKRLYLLRHAKSSWKHPELADHERPLAGRGRRAAEAIALHLNEHEIAPDLVLCSTARRARETFDRIDLAVPEASVRYETELYGATARSLLERLHRVPDGIASVMLIGHNPAIEQLALALSGPSHERRELEAKFPTAGLATLELPGSRWREVRHGDGTLVSFVRPRDLEPGTPGPRSS